MDCERAGFRMENPAEAMRIQEIAANESCQGELTTAL